MSRTKRLAKRLLPDRAYLKLLFRHATGASLNLHAPQTFNEKMQWLKLHYKNPLMSRYADKLAVKEIIAHTIDPSYVVPTLGQWVSAEEIDFSALPEKFVIKANHDSGSTIVCQDIAQFDEEKTRETLSRSLKRNYYYEGREWPYKDIRPLVFAEKYLDDIEWEFQTWNFNGSTELIAAISEPHGSNQKLFYDRTWTELPFVSSLPRLACSVKRPDELETIVKISEEIAAQFPFVRVDFIKRKMGALLIGEVTFYPASGFVQWNPPEWNEKLGCLLDLTQITI